MRNILVVRAGALGDGLLTIPALAALRTRWPEAHLTLIGPRTLLPFASASRLAGTVLAIEDEAGRAVLSDGGPKPWWANAELAVVWLQRWREVAQRLERWGCARVLGGPSLPAAEEPGHVADHLFRVLREDAIGPSCPRRPLVAPDHAATEAKDWWRRHMAVTPSPVIALHPGSGGLHKCWPADRYLTLAQRLLDGGAAVVICLGPAEAATADRWQAFAAGRSAIALALNLDLAVLAGILQHCSCFVGNDAGVTHLAAALGVPTVAIFGPTDPQRWQPVGRSVTVLRDPAWAEATPPTQLDPWRLTPLDVEQAVLTAPQPRR